MDTKRDNNGLEEFKIFSETKTLPELEKLLEDARINFFTAIYEHQPDELTKKYLDAYKLASDCYYARKWVK